ncbi:MAG: NADH-quinone oxidoreductase subunit NuoE [Burkholderiales bacterium]|jgi:NADH-quinone oxidoreductase subunit E|nr:NADH-quinone oxidoreductase subunit NuoE [Burkholderiales bacterium]
MNKLSAESYQKIDAAIAKYPPEHKQSAVMAALTIAQDERGWLSPETLKEIADYLDISPLAVYEVATFYTMYHLKSVGRYTLTVCTNLPCALQGANRTAEHLKKILNIDWGETTQDGMFTLLSGECMGACGEGPVLLRNNKTMCGNMTPQAVDSLLAELCRSRKGDADVG